MSNHFGFKDLVSPWETEDFLRRYWEQEPLFVRRQQPSCYDGCLSIAELEQFISCSGMRHPALRLVREGLYLPVESYTADLRWERDTFYGILDIARITEEFHSGATIVLQAAHMSLPSLRDICVELERSLGHRAHANVYLTPPNTKGFLPHYDTHDIFVMQIAGEKGWQVFKPTITMPDRSMPFRGDLSDLEKHGEYQLSPGDMLYFPRGYIHAAATSQLLSLHVTLGVDVYSWLDLIREVLHLARSNPEFRRALPARLLLADSGSNAETDGDLIVQVLRRFCQYSTSEDITASLRRLVTFNALSPHQCFNSAPPQS